MRVIGSIANAMTLAGGTLEGTGSVGTIGGSTRHAASGMRVRACCTASRWRLGAGVSVAIAINGPVVGTEYAQLDVTGA